VLMNGPLFVLSPTGSHRVTLVDAFTGMVYSTSIGVTPPKDEHIGLVEMFGKSAHAIAANFGCKSYGPHGVLEIGGKTWTASSRRRSSSKKI